MNIFSKFYYRTYQTVFKLMIPLLPYRQPKVLNSNEQVAQVLLQNGKKNVLLVTDQGINSLGLTKSLEKQLKASKLKVFVFDQVVPNPTSDNVQQALNMYKDNNCDCIVAFGGGSVMDCAKATGARVVYPKKSLKKMKGVLKVIKKIPLLIAVPTTAGTGSETTLASVIVDSETRHKYAINSFPLIPSYALLDANLTVGLPPHITSTTGLDALTHAIEAYIGRSTTKQTRAYALKAIKAVFENLPVAYQDGKNIQARQNMLQAAYDAGVAFTKSYVGYVHAIAHSLGGKYNVAHGLANAVVLPYVLKAFGSKINKKLYNIAVYCNLCPKETLHQDAANIVIDKIIELNKTLNIPTGIKELNVEDITELAKTAYKEAHPLYPVPVLFDLGKLEKIYNQILIK